VAVNTWVSLIWPQRAVIVSPLDRKACADRLADAVISSVEDWNQAAGAAMFGQPVSRQGLKGEVDLDGFRIARRIAYPSSMWTMRSAFETWASGTFMPSGEGTMIPVTLFVHHGVLVLWGVVLTLCLLVGLAAITNTLQGGLGLILVPGSFGLVSLSPRLLALGDGPYLLRFLSSALEARPQN
jgi:hypothetical protein